VSRPQTGRAQLQAALARLEGAGRNLEEARQQAREEAKREVGNAAELRWELRAQQQQELARLRVAQEQQTSKPSA
jgi:hypothetical protein